MSKKDAKTQPTPAPAATSATGATDLAPSRAGTIAVGSLMGAYVAVYLSVSLIKWFYFLYDDFDLAIYAQACHLAVRGSLYSPILGVNLLGNHMSLLIVPISWIYAALPSPVTLLVLQTVVLAFGALPVYWLARRELGNEFMAVSFAALYLLYPALGYTNLYQFHPETLTATTLLFTFYFLRTGRFRLMTLFAVLSLLAKEDVPLVVGPMGLYALVVNVPRRWLCSATLVGLAVAFLILAFVVVMPAVNRGEVKLEKIYEHWGPTTGEALVAMAKSPVKAVTELFTTPGDPDDATIKRQYYLQMLMPVLFLALLSPLTLAVALPAVAQHLLSGRPSDHTIVYHYTASVTPMVLAAAVLGLRNLLGLVSRRRPGALPIGLMGARTPAKTLGLLLSGLAVALAVACQLFFGPVVGFGVLQAVSAAEDHWPTPEQRALAPAMRRMLERVPADGAVAAGFRFMPHVINRPVVYSVHHVYKGTHTMSDKPYAIPEDVVAMVLDADSWLYLSFTRPGGGQRLRTLLDVNRLAPVDAAGDSVLFLRDAKDPLALYETGDFTPPNRRRVDYNSQVSFLGWDVPAAPLGPEGPRGSKRTVEAGGRVPLKTYWRRTAEVDRFYMTQFALFDEEGRENPLPPRRIGYTFCPAEDWPQDRTVGELYVFVVPAGMRPGTWTLGMRVIEDRGHRLAISRVDDVNLLRTNAYIPLGEVTVVERK